MKKMPVSVTQAEMWVLSADRQTVRFHIPPVRLAGRAEPLKLPLDCDAQAVDEVLERLTLLRSEMLPPPSRN